MTIANGICMTWSFPQYPNNWDEMRKAVFSIYGGRYCLKGIFKEFGHKGYLQVHHHVSLSKALHQSEYYFLNLPWNLVPLCEKHHIQQHTHMEDRISGKYNCRTYSKGRKVSWARRFAWYLKRKWYDRKFEKRASDDKILWFWNYWKTGEKNLKNEMQNWPKKYLEDLL